jgi:hypothetical protein
VAIDHQPPAETFVVGVTMMAKIRRIGKYPAAPLKKSPRIAFAKLIH